MATRILVADRTRARFFDRFGRELELRGTLDYPDGRRRDEDIEGGMSRRTFDSHARGHDAGSSPHEHAATAFAKELAAELRRARMEDGVERIVLVAEPHFLGLVHHELDQATEKLVVATVPKDFVRATPAVIADHLGEIPEL